MASFILKVVLDQKLSSVLFAKFVSVSGSKCFDLSLLISNDIPNYVSILSL